jgi:hypothetical protein
MNLQLNGGGVNCAVLSLCTVLLLPVMLPVLHVKCSSMGERDFWFVCSSLLKLD